MFYRRYCIKQFFLYVAVIFTVGRLFLALADFPYWMESAVYLASAICFGIGYYLSSTIRWYLYRYFTISPAWIGILCSIAQLAVICCILFWHIIPSWVVFMILLLRQFSGRYEPDIKDLCQTLDMELQWMGKQQNMEEDEAESIFTFETER